MLLGAATIALVAGAQSTQPQQTQTTTAQPSTTNQQNTATPAQQTQGVQQQPEVLLL